MSRKSARYSNPKNRKSRSEWESDKAYHQSKLEHQQYVLKQLGLAPVKKSKEDKQESSND